MVRGIPDPPIGEREQAFRIEGVSVFYGEKAAIRDATLGIPARSITALIGPSGCGKSTLLRCLNRMNDLIPSFRMEGTVAYGGLDLYGRGVDVTELRRKIGMVFQKPNPFPKSIYENIAFGLRIQGAGRLVHQDNLRFDGDGPGDAEPLLLAAREP